jgi:hypothetical protein
LSVSKLTLLQRKFDDLLIESIDTVLSRLSEPVKNEFYIRLENNFHMERQNIPYEIEEFSKILHRIFGSGASILEINFMRSLYSKCAEVRDCSMELAKNEMTFSKYVKKMRERVEML